ncbi:MAG: hypothetical protein WHU10_10760 [Fimbriimonadales bacterium]
MILPSVGLAVSFAFLGEPLEVVRAERTEALAGRLGRRVEQTLVVRDSSGRERTVRAGACHTRVARSHGGFRAGDRILVRRDALGGVELVKLP